MVVACIKMSCLGPVEARLKFFTLVCRDITTHLMTTESLAPQTTSDGSITTHCTISIISNLVTPNLATTKMSFLSAPPLVPNLPNELKIPLQFPNSMHSVLSCPHILYTPHLKHLLSLSLLPPPTGSLPLVVELRILNNLKY